MTIKNFKTKKKPKDWCFKDSKGRMIGYMFPEDLIAALDGIWGRGKGRWYFAKYSGLNYETIKRYCNARIPIPKHIAILVEFMQRSVPKFDPASIPYEREINLPIIKAAWLPEFKDEEKIVLAYRPYG